MVAEFEDLKTLVKIILIGCDLSKSIFPLKCTRIFVSHLYNMKQFF